MHVATSKMLRTLYRAVKLSKKAHFVMKRWNEQVLLPRSTQASQGQDPLLSSLWSLGSSVADRDPFGRSHLITARKFGVKPPTSSSSTGPVELPPRLLLGFTPGQFPPLFNGSTEHGSSCWCVRELGAALTAFITQPSWEQVRETWTW